MNLAKSLPPKDQLPSSDLRMEDPAKISGTTLGEFGGLGRMENIGRPRSMVQLSTVLKQQNSQKVAIHTPRASAPGERAMWSRITLLVRACNRTVPADIRQRLTPRFCGKGGSTSLPRLVEDSSVNRGFLPAFIATNKRIAGLSAANSPSTRRRWLRVVKKFTAVFVTLS